MSRLLYQPRLHWLRLHGSGRCARVCPAQPLNCHSISSRKHPLAAIISSQLTRCYTLCEAAAAGMVTDPDPGVPINKKDSDYEEWGGGTGERMPGQKRSVAMHVAYVGTKFRGLQLSRDFPAETTVEGVVELALLKANLIAPSNYGDLFKIKWTRSSRTDKGVHSLATVIGVRIVMVDADDIFTGDPEGMQVAALVNAHLPDSVRVLSVQRVTKKFNARRFCAERSYEYYLPASVLGLKLDGGEEDQRILSVFRASLAKFVGRFPFHNYTVRRGQYLDTPGSLAQRAAKAPTTTGADAAATGDGAQGGLDPTTETSQVAAQAVEGQVSQVTPKKKSRRKSKAGDDIIEDDDGADELLGAAGQPVSLQQELEAEAQRLAASLGGITLDAGGKQVPRVWQQLCGWVGELSEKDRVGVRHYRIITEFTAGDPAPLVPGGVPCIQIRVTGGSFMLNQIRHMIGGAVAVAVGILPERLLAVSLTAPARVSVPKAPPHTLILAGCEFPEFRKAGLAEAKVAQWSGASLQLRAQGAAARQRFMAEALGPELNQLLSHSDWSYFIESLGWFYWDPAAQQQVYAAHDAWAEERVRLKAEKAAAAAVEADVSTLSDQA